MAEKDYYLKIDGIAGESQKAGHVGEIEMDDWAFGETNSGASSHGQATGTGRVSMQDFRFSKPVDSSSPKLFQTCASGKHIKNAVFTARRSGTDGGAPIDYLKVTFGDLIISSYDTSATGVNGAPRETISFNFSNLKMDYVEVKSGNPAGTTSGGYDVKLNKKI